MKEEKKKKPSSSKPKKEQKEKLKSDSSLSQDKKTAKEKIKNLKEPNKKKKKKRFIIITFICLSLGVFLYSSYQIILWQIDSKKIDDITEEIQDKVTIEEIEVEDEENIQVVEPEEKIESDPYWDYVKMNLIDVNFTELQSLNSETQGWIQVNGTNINYPFVQHSDNKYYLTHQFDKSYNGGGWVFLDYRNNIETLDKNTIIYAHGRENKTMFGSLKNILNSNWYNNKDNHIIKLSTKYQNTLWQVFSVYRIPNTNDYIKTTFSNEEEFKEFADMLQQRSAVKFNTMVSKTDKILTLSTCWDDYEKVVMHAKLIKYSNR